MSHANRTTLALIISLLALTGCSSLSGGEQEFPSGEARATVLQRQQGGSIFDMIGGGTSESGVLFSSARSGEGLAGSVNKHLWMASLETLGFLPIASTDPFTGVIATDWGAAADKPGERFKVTAYVTDVALDPKALRVAVYREVLSETGAWTAAPVAEDTPRKIEDSILVRARQLRLEERTKG